MSYLKQLYATAILKNGILYPEGVYAMATQELSELSALGEAIARANRDLVNIWATRMCLAEEVARYKIRNGSPILRKGKERQRITQMVRWARENGIKDLEAVRSLAYLVIAASCRIQVAAKEAHEKVRKR